MIFEVQQHQDFELLADSSHGINAKVYKVQHNQFGVCALKFFPAHDQLVSLKREVLAVTVLRKQGCQAVPKILAVNDKENYVLYQWLEGQKIAEATQEDMQQIFNFLQDLKILSLTTTEQFQPAKDACFSIKAVWQLIYRRYCNLTLSQEVSVLGNFMKKLYAMIECIERSSYKNRAFAPMMQDIHQQERILSPSDISFNNMIKVGGHKIYFIDFEFFGWDDPIKLMCDFLWHPQNKLSRSLQHSFLEQCFKLFKADHFFKQRLAVLYPCYGLIWSMIILNNFVPQIWQNRVHQQLVDASTKETILRAQLTKAEIYLQRINEADEYICDLIADLNT